MNETEFHHCADATLEGLFNLLEDADQDGALDVEYQDGILTIVLESGKQLIVNKHAPSQQLWLSSPISGGLHFSHAAMTQWALSDGRTLSGVLAQELRSLAGLEVAL